MLTTTNPNSRIANPADKTEAKASPFRRGSPLGFEAGDANLYRYVDNNPATETDPSGLQALAGYGTRGFWENVPRRELDISGYTDSYIIGMRLGRIDSDFPLTTLPRVAFNENRQIAINPIQADGRGIATPAQLARINIRANLVAFKQQIVNAVVRMLQNTAPVPPHGVQATPAAFETAANEVADALIRATDEFMRTHPGARPSLGARNGFANLLGISNAQNAPWCGDWGPAMRDALFEAQRIGQLNTARNFIRFLPGQAFDPGLVYDLEHNFIIIAPAGHSIRFSTPGNDAVDTGILIFDPWRELIPTPYVPTPWSQQPRRTPTNLFPRQEQLEKDKD